MVAVASVVKQSELDFSVKGVDYLCLDTEVGVLSGICGVPYGDGSLEVSNYK